MASLLVVEVPSSSKISARPTEQMELQGLWKQLLLACLLLEKDKPCGLFSLFIAYMYTKNCCISPFALSGSSITCTLQICSLD